MKQKVIDYFIDELNILLENESLDEVKENAYKIYNDLKEKYKDDSKKLKKQTLNNMYPIISVYKSLKSYLNDSIKALRLMDKINQKRTLKSANSTSKMLKVFGLYKLYPSIFKKVTLKSFNKDIGFDPEFVIANKNQCKFNMKKCLYCSRCKKEDCFELVPVFCNKDIVFNSNLHEKLIWHRDGTLAENKEYCDFDIKLVK